jgi:hypothetical protein
VAAPSPLLSDVQDMIDRFLTGYAEDAALAEQLVKDLGRNQVADLQATGEAFCRIAEQALRRHDLIARCVHLGSDGVDFSGYHDLDKFRQARDEYARLLTWFRGRWPWLDHDRLRRAHASLERGDCRPTKGFLDELRASAHP